MRVQIESRINVDGQWWDLTTYHEVPDAIQSKEKVGYIKKIVQGLAKTGEIISRVPGGLPEVEQPTSGNGGGVHSECARAAFTWPIPYCKVHSDELTPSKVQRDEEYINFYCPKRAGEGYCKQRAKVEKGNGFPTFWEVKK